MNLDFDVLVIGCGLSGSAAARELAEKGKKVEIWERRDHIGGNMYDYVDEYGILVHKYGPHTFHTKDKALFDYICKFERWSSYKLTCGAVWDEKYTPTPFNFTAIDAFYPAEEAEILKNKISAYFKGRKTAGVVELMEHDDEDIRKFAGFLFENDYAPYTAKQWGVLPSEIDPCVLKRVPVRFSYDTGYFDDDYQVMPEHSYAVFFRNLLDHPGITVRLGLEALEHIAFEGENILIDGKAADFPVIYTGALDELFGMRYGKLPYRSLRFEWKHSDKKSIQNDPVVAYPKAEGYTRITEYNKLPVQETDGSSYAVEYPLPYEKGKEMEPYYPVLTAESQECHEKYKTLADGIKNLFYCGRLADFKYYNMDQALKRSLEVYNMIEKDLI